MDIIIRIICFFIGLVLDILAIVSYFLPWFTGIAIGYGLISHNGLYIAIGFALIVVNATLVYLYNKKSKQLRWISYISIFSSLFLSYDFLYFFWEVNKGLPVKKEEFEMFYNSVQYFCIIGSIIAFTQHFFKIETPE
ncbi:MAG: hypothetical protein NT068_03600 [Candidatus Nomurabacteria bacterium]|nr:hypothetical protein [Candidatus Nomurabacteria bacterium]